MHRRKAASAIPTHVAVVIRKADPGALRYHSNAPELRRRAADAVANEYAWVSACARCAAPTASPGHPAAAGTPAALTIVVEGAAPNDRAWPRTRFARGCGLR